MYGYGGPETEERPHAAIQASDGGYVIVGETAGNAGSRIFVVRTDEGGVLRFARSYRVGRFNFGNYVLQEADGRFLIAGSWDAGTGARDGGFAVFADSDEHGPGWSNFALFKLAADPAAPDAKP